jgi:hypothetical protein
MRSVPGLKVVKDDKGFLCAEEEGTDTDRPVFGTYKAERLLYFTARSMALAGWASLEALNDFYEHMMEACVLCSSSIWVF